MLSICSLREQLYYGYRLVQIHRQSFNMHQKHYSLLWFLLLIIIIIVCMFPEKKIFL